MRIPKPFRFALSLVVLASAALPSRLLAFDDWQPISADELKMTSEPAQPDAASVILYREDISDDNKTDHYYYRRIKILTEQGRKYADVKIPYNNRYFHISDFKARTIHADGAVIPFEGKLLDSTLVKGKGIKILQKTFTLPDVQVGSIIEYKYRMHWDRGVVFAPRWLVQDEMFQKRVKFSYAPSTHDVEAKDGSIARVSWTSLFLPAGADVKQHNGRVDLDLTDIPAFVEEKFSPPADELKMRVQFFYIRGDATTTAKFWEKEGKDWSKGAEKFMNHSQAVQQEATRLIAANDPNEQKLRKLYARVQQITNLSYQRERTAAEEKKENFKDSKSVEDVLRQNAGYHNELTRLFVAMSRAIGLDARLAIVSTRDETFFTEQVFDFDQLNSEVAVVRADGKDVYLDPGTRYCPFGLVDWKRSGVRGLIQTAKGGAEFITTPPPELKNALTQRAALLTLSEDGNLKGKARLVFTGQEALARRLQENENDEAGRTKDLEEELRGLLPATATVHLDSAKGWGGQDDPIDATFSVEIPGYAAATGKRLLLPTNLFESQTKQAFVHDKRVNPVYFEYPYRTLDRIIINVPNSLQIESLPKQQKVLEEFAGFVTTYEGQGQKIIIQRQLDEGGFLFPLKYYPALKSFYEKVKSSDEETAILRVTTVAKN